MGTKRDILNYLGIKIGELELPNETTEDQWIEKLSLYSQPPKTMAEMQKDQIIVTNKQKIAFCEQLIIDLKEKNVSDGINALQALWLHHRLRELDINFYGFPMKVDISNMFLSGDVETACIALMNCTPDDMSTPYHFFSTARRDWVVNKIKEFLGWT